MNWLPENESINNKNLPKSSWTRFRICPRRKTSKGSRWDAETSSAWRYNEEANMAHERAQPYNPNLPDDQYIPPHTHRHPELVSGSVRGERQEKARSEMLNLRLSESRGKLAWTMPSVSKLNKVKQVQHDVAERKRLKDAKPKANSRGLLSPWKQRRRIKMASDKTRNGNASEGLKAPRYSSPRLYRRTNCRTDSYSTGLKTRGYLTSRLSDE